MLGLRSRDGRSFLPHAPCCRGCGRPRNVCGPVKTASSQTPRCRRTSRKELYYVPRRVHLRGLVYDPRTSYLSYGPSHTKDVPLKSVFGVDRQRMNDASKAEECTHHVRPEEHARAHANRNNSRLAPLQQGGRTRVQARPFKRTRRCVPPLYSCIGSIQGMTPCLPWRVLLLNVRSAIAVTAPPPPPPPPPPPSPPPLASLLLRSPLMSISKATSRDLLSRFD